MTAGRVPWGVVAATAVALVLRVWIVGAVGFNPRFFDVDSYHAQALAGFAGPVPTDTHPPGYPWFLMAVYALAGVRVRLVYLVQAVLSSLAVLVVGLTAARRFGPRAGTLAAAVLALSGYLAIAPSSLASETLCVFGVALLLPLAVAPGRPGLLRLAAAAAVIGLLALVRTALLALAPGVVWLAWSGLGAASAPLRRRAAGALLVACVAAAPATVYGLVRAGRSGVFHLGSPWDTYNLWVGNNPDATGRIDPMPGVPPLGSPGVADENARAALLGPRAVRYAVTHPVRELGLVARRASYLFAPAKRDLVYIYSHGWAGERSPGVILAVYIWVAASVPVLLALALVGLGRRWDDRPLRVCVVLVALGAAPYLASIGDARFLMPLHPLLAFAAGAVLAGAGAGGPGRLRWALVGAALIALAANTARDLELSRPALEAVMAPGGSTLDAPYHFAR